MSGIGAGIDVKSIVDGLISIQQRELNQLNHQKSLYEYQQKAYSSFKTLLSAFTNSLDKFQSIFENNLYKTATSNENIVNLGINSQTAGVGDYSLQITQLAKSEQISSQSFSSSSDPLAFNGNLKISVAGQSMNLSLDENDSLETIKDHINHSLNNPGVLVNILKTSDPSGDDEYRLIFTSRQSGTANAMQITGDGLNFPSIDNILQNAQDANFTINGLSVVRSSNDISDVIDGISFHLYDTGNAIMSVQSDTENEMASMTDAFQTLIHSYNDLINQLDKNQSLSYLRDGTYPLIKSHLKQAMDKQFDNGAIKSLLDLGVKSDNPEKITNEEGTEYIAGGKLIIDSAVWEKALKNNTDEIRSFFNNKNDNMIKSLSAAVNDIENKTITGREKIILQQTTYIEHSMGREESRLDDMRKNLTTKYAELDVFLAKYNQIGDFLDQQLASMNPKKGR